MSCSKLFAAALLCAAAWAGESPVEGKWSCTNVSVSGARSPWTLQIRAQGAELAGSISDGEIELPLSDVKLDGRALHFRFFINGKPYAYEGTLDGRKLEGKYTGEEAGGSLLCERPSS